MKELKVVKVIELMGESPNGWQEATENTLTETSKTVRNIVGLEVVGWTAKIEKNKIVSYRANVKIAFIAERP